jgi:hypothetical protein
MTINRDADLLECGLAKRHDKRRYAGHISNLSQDHCPTILVYRQSSITHVDVAD